MLCSNWVKQEADGRVPNDAGSTVQIATPNAQPTASCAEHNGLKKNVMIKSIQ